MRMKTQGSETICVSEKCFINQPLISQTIYMKYGRFPFFSQPLISKQCPVIPKICIFSSSVRSIFYNNGLPPPSSHLLPSTSMLQRAARALHDIKCKPRCTKARLTPTDDQRQRAHLKRF